MDNYRRGSYDFEAGFIALTMVLIIAISFVMGTRKRRM
jgi:hypothetical protein